MAMKKLIGLFISISEYFRVAYDVAMRSDKLCIKARSDFLSIRLSPIFVKNGYIESTSHGAERASRVRSSDSCFQPDT